MGHPWNHGATKRGAASGAPKGEAQGIAKQLAAFSGAGGRPISRALRGESWWRNQWARAVIWVAVSKPRSSSGVGWAAGIVRVELGCSLLQPETYESFPPVGRVVIRGNGEKPHVLTLTMRCCPA